MTEIEGIQGQAIALIERYARMSHEISEEIKLLLEPENWNESICRGIANRSLNLAVITHQRKAVRDAIIEMGILTPEELESIEREQQAWGD